MTEKRTTFFRLLFSLIVVIPIFFISCSNDSDDSNNGTKSHKTLEKEIDFLNKDYPTVSSEWGTFWQKYQSVGIFVSDPSNIFLGVAYPASEVLNASLTNPVDYIKNSFDLLCNTSKPYHSVLPEGAGKKEYDEVYKNLISSPNYEAVLNGGSRLQISNDQSINSYSDLKSYFLGRSDIGKLFLKKAYENTKKLKYVKGRRFIFFINLYPKIYMDESENGLFKESKYNTEEFYKQGQEPVYASSISYGKVVWAIIESEYDNATLLGALYLAKEYKYDKAKIDVDENLKKILDKTVITVMSVGNQPQLSCKQTTIEEFGSQVSSTPYTNETFGSPAFVLWRYVSNQRTLL